MKEGQVQVPHTVIPIKATVTLSGEGSHWSTWKIRYGIEQLAVVHVRKFPNLIFDSKAMAKLFSVEEELED